jgi:hypothetical protein
MKRIAATGIVLILCGGSAFAQGTPSAAQPPVAQGPTTPAPRPNAATPGAGDVCQPDLTQFCSAVQPGMGRLIACLNTHKTALRPACRDRIDAIDKIEADLAAKAHEPVDQFLAEHYAHQAQGGVWVKKPNALNQQPGGAPAPGASPAPSGQTPPPSPHP